MTVLWARWPIWGIRSRTKRSATFCVDTTSRQRRSGVARRLGRSFLQTHLDVLASADFFTVEVLTWRGLVTYFVLFFIEVGSRRVRLGGITRHPESWWMQQVARNATMEGSGYLNGCRYLLHDRYQKFCREFRETLAVGGVKCLLLPARSPNLNAHAERWVRSIKEECLSRLILFGENSLRRVVSEFLEHYHGERNHQGKDNVLLFPAPAPLEPGQRSGIHCRERLGGLLRYYSRAA
jgi:putative transposase